MDIGAPKTPLEHRNLYVTMNPVILRKNHILRLQKKSIQATRIPKTTPQKTSKPKNLSLPNRALERKIYTNQIITEITDVLKRHRLDFQYTLPPL